jgi:hypothetical protein
MLFGNPLRILRLNAVPTMAHHRLAQRARSSGRHVKFISASRRSAAALIWIKPGVVRARGSCDVRVQNGRKPMKQVTRAAIAASVLASAALFSVSWSEQAGLSLSVESVQARVGRPATPVSVAGVARRHTRRAVYGAGLAGAAVVGTAAAAAAAPYYYGTGYYAGGPSGAGTGPYAYSPGYGGWDDYAKRNGIVCRPGTMVKLDDGKMYPCQ